MFSLQNLQQKKRVESKSYIRWYIFFPTQSEKFFSRQQNLYEWLSVKYPSLKQIYPNVVDGLKLHRDFV